MSDQQSLNQLLQWGIENSANAQGDTSTHANGQQRDASRGFDSKALAELLGGPSDADRMRQAMTAIIAPVNEVDLENKMIAWDNLEQLIEQLDNANNLESLGMWPPLLAQLDSTESEMRRMGAWCCSTAVQNNIKSQENLLRHGGISKLAKLATGDPVQAVRKKAVSALSSEVRNFQPGMDELQKSLPQSLRTSAQAADAGDMDVVDALLQRLRDHSAQL